MSINLKFDLIFFRRRMSKYYSSLIIFSVWDFSYSYTVVICLIYLAHSSLQSHRHLLWFVYSFLL